MKKLWALFAMLFMGVAQAVDGSGAAQLIESQGNLILQNLQQNATMYKANPNAFTTFIESNVAPQIDFNKMAEIALGRNLKKVKEAGKFDAFSQAFRKLIIRAYSKGWDNYTHADFKVLGTPNVDEYNRATVRVQVSDNNGKKSNVSFAVWYHNGAWKLYDATFENISLMTSYRNTFDTDLQKMSIDALIQKISNNQVQ